MIRLGLLSILLFSSPAWSYLNIGGSADIPKGSMAGLEIQSMTNQGGGTLFNGFYERSHSEEMSSRYSLGFGSIDYNLGAALKWTPYPDTKTQPAIGFRGSFWYAKNKDVNTTTIQVAAMASKRFAQDFGALAPFAALALNFNNSSTAGATVSTTGTQLNIGSDLHLNSVKNMHFTGEIGANIKDTASFVAISVTVPLEGENAFFKRK